MIHDVEQGSEEWHQLRLGRITASNFAIIMGKPGATRDNYIRRLAAETITGERTEVFQTAAMSRGIALEEEARSFYEFETGRVVSQVGFITHPDFPHCGDSPDGLVDDNAALEIKCPSPHTHVEYLESGKLPSKYKWQVAGHLLFTGRKYCDFVSYCPGLPLFVTTVQAFYMPLDELRDGLTKASAELLSLIESIEGKF